MWQQLGGNARRECDQRAHQHGHHMHAHANLVATEDGCRSQDSSHHCLWCRYHVSLLDSDSAIHSNFKSAVSITILRFVSVAQASDDWQSAVVRVALWTNLEAMLGILCACLPLIRPAVARVFYLATGRVALQSSSKPTPAISSTVARIRQKSHAGNQSQGIMEDQYPLTEGRNWRDPEHTTGARTNTTAVGKREVERKGNVVSQSPEDRIRVQSEWYVTRE